MIGVLLRPGPVTAIACAVVLGILPMQAAAQVEPPAPSDPIAIIGSSVITDTEIDRIAAGRPGAYADLPPAERRTRIIDSLVAEYLIDYHYGRDTRQLSPAVLDALSDARRQVLLQFFAQSQFAPPKITTADQADFVARNPALFGDRRSYSFAIVTLSGGTQAGRQAVQDQVQNLAAQPEAQIAALDDLVSALPPEGVTATLNTVWQPSEALAADVLARLEAMVRDNRRIDISAQTDVTSILLLDSAIPIPAEPAKLRNQIEQRLMAEAFGRHRDALVRRIALTVLDPPAALAANQAQNAESTVALPPRGEVVWSSRPNLPRKVRLAALFGAGVFGTLAGYLIWTWLRLVMAQYQYTLKSHPEVPFLRKRSTSFVVTAIAGLGLLTSAAAVVTIGLQTLGRGATGVTLAGGVTTALAIAAVWYVWSTRAFNQAVDAKEADYDSIRAARQILFRKRKSGRTLVGAVAFAALYGLSLALLLDAPSGPP